MKVLLISHTAQSRTEGQPRAQALGRIPGVELLLLTPERWMHYGAWRRAQKPIEPSFGFWPSRIALPWLGPLQNYAHFYPAMGAVLQRFQPDIIDLWEEPWGAVSAQAAWLRDRIVPRARLISETEQNIFKKLPPPFESLRSYTLRHANCVIARSSEAADVIRRKDYSGPLHVVPNCVDAELFRPLDRAKCRRELGLEAFTVGYIGRLVEEKGLEDLLEALALCPPEVQLLFVGEGDFKQVLEAKVRALNLAPRVRFEGARPLQQLPSVMNAIDVLALPSRTTASWKEQFGRVLIEANACATPVIGSDSGAIPDVVGAGGLVVPEQNPAALAQAIEKLAGDENLRRAMGEVGRAQAEEKYTWERVAQQMHAIYTSLLA
jgi:glycosyltransferase involved in cell wall biosynthesis